MQDFPQYWIIKYHLFCIGNWEKKFVWTLKWFLIQNYENRKQGDIHIKTESKHTLNVIRGVKSMSVIKHLLATMNWTLDKSLFKI
jgi:hypothetical protein